MNLINNSTSAAIFWWRPGAWLRVSGPDAANFLQGQFTNDLRPLETGNAVYGLWLNTKGKVMADSFVLRGRTDDEFWIGSYFSRAATIRERLESHIIADDVNVEDVTDGWSAVTMFGQEKVKQTPEGFRFVGRRGVTHASEWVFPNAASERGRLELAGAAELGIEEMARRRIEARIPAVPVDIGPGDLPNEGELDRDAISFTKGCYLGQEVMARLKTMGQVRRRLLRVKSPGAETPALPAPMFAGPRRVGELRSAVRGPEGIMGLALLSLLHLVPGVGLSLTPDTEPQWWVVDSP